MLRSTPARSPHSRVTNNTKKIVDQSNINADKEGVKLKCINLIEIINKGKQKYKEEGHSYFDVGKLRRGGILSERQTNQQKIKPKRKSDKIFL